jgi:hypothetical protein
MIKCYIESPAGYADSVNYMITLNFRCYTSEGKIHPDIWERRCTFHPSADPKIDVQLAVVDLPDGDHPSLNMDYAPSSKGVFFSQAGKVPRKFELGRGRTILRNEL